MRRAVGFATPRAEAFALINAQALFRAYKGLGLKKVLGFVYKVLGFRVYPRAGNVEF